MAINRRTNQAVSGASARAFYPTNVASTSTWATLTAVLQDNPGGTGAYAIADLQSAKYVRVSGYVTTVDAAAGAELRVQYSLDGGSTWAYFDATAGTGKSITTGTTFAPGPWHLVPEAAKRPAVVLRVVGFGGTGAASPIIKNVGVEVSF